VQAGLSKKGLAEAARMLMDNLRLMVEAGVVHGDLSAFNVLWWDDTVWIIDVPQALDLADEGGVEYLRRDLANIATWFTGRGVDLDPDRLFGELMRSLA
jgi:RIO kinase 1